MAAQVADVAAKAATQASEAFFNRLLETGLLGGNQAGMLNPAPPALPPCPTTPAPPAQMPVLLAEPPAPTTTTAGASAAAPLPYTTGDPALAQTAVNALMYQNGNVPLLSQPANNLASTPLGYHVDDKVKSKIWSNQYVDYKVLLPGHYDTQYGIQLVTNQSGTQSLKFTPTTDAHPITNIDKWATAHNTFSYIFIQKFPHAAPALLKYAEIIRDLARRFGPAAFQFYDENFRALRQSNPDLPFEVPHHELWMRAATMKTVPKNNTSPNTNQPFRPSAQGYQVPRGFCYAFNKPNTHCKTPSCPYKHMCPTCNQPHPKFKCSATNQPARPTTSTGHRQPTTPKAANTSRSQ